MGDPTSYVSAKIASAVGGFFGGAGMMTFIRPKTITEAFIRGGVSVGSAIIFAGPLLNMAELKSNWEYQLMAGAVVGFVAYSILGAVANFFIKNQNDDIVTLIQKVKKPRKKKRK